MAEQSTAEHEVTVEDLQRRIQRAIGAMPYGGIVHARPVLFTIYESTLMEDQTIQNLTLAGERLAALHEQLRAEPELRADPTGVDCAERYEGIDH